MVKLCSTYTLDDEDLINVSVGPARATAPIPIVAPVPIPVTPITSDAFPRLEVDALGQRPQTQTAAEQLMAFNMALLAARLERNEKSDTQDLSFQGQGRNNIKARYCKIAPYSQSARRFKKRKRESIIWRSWTTNKLTAKFARESPK